MTEERKDQLLWLWGEETNDPETQEWRDELTPEEADKVAEWDANAEHGMGEMSRHILELEEEQKRKKNGEYRMAVARAQSLLQRAEKLREGKDITRRLNELLEVTKRTQKAEHWQVNTKGFNDVLNSMEREIQAREAAAKRERKSDMALVNAVGDLADGIADGLQR